MNTFFTSDTHFGHENILKYCNRPFKDVAEMNEELIRRWNARVRPGDRVYHLGDFALAPVEQMIEIRQRLAGDLTVLLGNHDPQNRILRILQPGDALVTGTLYLTVEGMLVSMRHRPEAPPTKESPLDYAFCGHEHEKFSRRGKLINVGVDVRDFEPKTFAELVR